MKLVLALLIFFSLSASAQQSARLDSLERYVLNDEGWIARPHLIDVDDPGHPKHDACVALADGLLEAKQYEKALRFYRLSADTFHHRGSFCGNDNEGRYISLLACFAKCYAGMNRVDTTIAILIPHAIYNMDPQPELQAQLRELLVLQYGKDSVLNEMNNAVKTIKVKDGLVQFIGRITLFNHEVYVGFWYKESVRDRHGIDIHPATEASRKELLEVKMPALFAERYKESDGYKILTSL